jgi:hypothetical protein
MDINITGDVILWIGGKERRKFFIWNNGNNMQKKNKKHTFGKVSNKVRNKSKINMPSTHLVWLGTYTV